MKTQKFKEGKPYGAGPTKQLGFIGTINGVAATLLASGVKIGIATIALGSAAAITAAIIGGFISFGAVLVVKNLRGHITTSESIATANVNQLQLFTVINNSINKVHISSQDFANILSPKRLPAGYTRNKTSSEQCEINSYPSNSLSELTLVSQEEYTNFIPLFQNVCKTASGQCQPTNLTQLDKAVYAKTLLFGAPASEVQNRDPETVTSPLININGTQLNVRYSWSEEKNKENTKQIFEILPSDNFKLYMQDNKYLCSLKEKLCVQLQMYKDRTNLVLEVSDLKI